MDDIQKNSIEISVVIPVFKSAQILTLLYQRLKNVLDSLGQSWEIIMVDDGSSDNSYEMMQEIRSKDKKVKIIQLAKNHGQVLATFCGLKHSKGNYVITMDDDLQHPPEEIPKMINKLTEEYDVVIGKYRVKRHNMIRNGGSFLIQYLMKLRLGIPWNFYVSSFRGFTRDAVNSITGYKGKKVFLVALIFRSVPPARIANVEIEHLPRRYGASTYTWSKLFKFTSFLLTGKPEENPFDEEQVVILQKELV